MSAQTDYVPFSHYIPQPPLSEYVDVLWIYEGYSVPHAQERLMPTGAMELVICLDEDDRMGSGLSGVQSSFTILNTTRPFSLIGVHFKAGAVSHSSVCLPANCILESSGFEKYSARFT